MRKKKNTKIHPNETPLGKSSSRLGARKTPVPIAIFGEPGIDFETGVFDQMKNAAILPVAVRGAIMPDGHVGYALPIGGVIALNNAVSPSFVGYDIACRMTMSLLDIPVDDLLQNKMRIAGDMRSVSRFGLGSGFRGRERRQHIVMDNPLWKQVKSLRELRSLAEEQLGSSGGGNHFFDVLVGEVISPAPWMPLRTGEKFVAIMTHSGSRGTGNKIAHYYQTLAAEQTHRTTSGIPRGYEWLDLETLAGQEYWEVMNLMGRYAQANHNLIHDNFLKKTGIGQLVRWENHHNFAFLEGGLIVHRKGATPAEKGSIGIIPGTSGTPSYLVEGLGNSASLNSSSHGAGRPRSRTASKKMHNEHAFVEYMKQLDILYFGVTPDETYLAYKDIERIMALQEGVLVRTVARLHPRVVIMGGRADDGD